MTKPDVERSIQDVVLRTLKYFLWFVALTLISIISLYFWKSWNALGALIVLFSASGVGAVLGFLFGIPRVLTTDGIPDPAGKPNTSFAQNSNLEQISDWLTKIVVGVSLVEFDRLIGALRRLSGAVALALELNANLWPVVSAVLVCGGIFGFITFYIWTRTQFPLLLQLTQTQLARLLTQIADLKSVVIENVKVLDKTIKFAGIEESKDILQGKASFQDGWDSDPHKGKFGGSAVSGEYKLEADVVPIGEDGALCGVTLTVTRPNALGTQQVQFHLHPTFKQSVVQAEFNGLTASTKILSRGAFVVGALVKSNDGEADIQLELDLATVPRVPEKFKNG